MKAGRNAAVAAIFVVDVVAGVVADVRIVEEAVVVADEAETGAMAANCLSQNMPRTVRMKILPPNPRRPKATFRRSFPASHWQNTRRHLRHHR
jgi:hypothetical protein